jgi:hypothetical protein
MPTWECIECNDHCKLERETTFPPERCIYKDRPGHRTAFWRIVNDRS